MRYIRINESDHWNLGKFIAERLIEVDDSGAVHRVIDLDNKGSIIDAAPTAVNQYGATDHPPLSMESDWSENFIMKEVFEKLWGIAKETLG